MTAPGNGLPRAGAIETRSGTGQRRPPPRSVQFLLPVWGSRYITQFLNFGLPTLLAPGNIPAVAGALPCKFVFLTNAQDAEFIRDHPQTRSLASLCDIDIQPIDDLITGDNYSTTITLAYERAVRATAQAMLDTCFFFLISDYLVADGALAHVLARMQAGASGILAGNFQVIEEDAVETLHARFAQAGRHDLVLPARDLVAWALPHLHAMTAANTVNFPLCHSAHSNRLFWRVDERTLIGRFYLMHMICIRPDTCDFIIGASCDYSFISEMCPSQRIEVLTDSDDYLVVEMQPRDHERHFLKLGRMRIDSLAASLSEWTTARHRENAKSMLVYHAGEIPDTLGAVAAQSNAFVEEIGRRLAPMPQPHRDHPYWLGAIAAHRWAQGRRIGATVPEPVRDRSLRDRMKDAVHWLRVATFGQPPNVRRCHPRWPDYHALTRQLRRRLTGENQKLMVLFDSLAFVTGCMDGLPARAVTYECSRLFELGPRQYAMLADSFDGCMVVLQGEEELSRGRRLIARIRPLLKAHGFILVFAVNGRGTAMSREFQQKLVSSATQFLDMETWLNEVHFISAGWLRVAIIRTMMLLSSAVTRRPLLYFPVATIAGACLAPLSLACNWFAMMSGSETAKPNANCSSVCMELRPSAARAASAPSNVDENPTAKLAMYGT